MSRERKTPANPPSRPAAKPAEANGTGRKPYRAPKVRAYGNIRDITLGTGSTRAERWRAGQPQDQHLTPAVRRFSYSAFGLVLASSGPIPRLAGAASKTDDADAQVELGRRPDWFSSSRPTHIRYTSPYHDAAGTAMLTLGELDNGWLRLSFADGADFLVDPPGRHVWAVWPAHFTIDDASSYLLGPVMGFVLRLRGRVCLHASAVAVDGSAFVLAGASGAGKSTTAAAFAASGWPVLADDIVPVSESEADGRFQAHPGYPRLRLWPSAAGALERLWGRQPMIPADWGERRYHLDLVERGYLFQAVAAPLAAVYVLNPRDASLSAPAISPCTGTDALIALVTHSFASTLLDRDMRAHDLSTLGRLADAVPVRAVTPPASPDELPALVAAILDDLRSLPRSNQLAACAE